MKKSMKLSMLAVGLACAAVITASAAPYVILKNGNRIDGKEIRAKNDGSIVLLTDVGMQTFPADQVAKAFADRPAAFNRAKELAQAKKYDEAVNLLERIINEYRNLGWDVQARAVLAQVYNEKGDYTKAISAYEEIFEDMNKAEIPDALLWTYRSALLQAERYSKLDLILDEVIAEGSHENAAKAQVMRGKIKEAEGNKTEAVLDYLRTVILFEGVTEVQPEALYRTGMLLKELRDDRAKDMFTKLINEYPSSSYASRARAEI